MYPMGVSGRRRPDFVFQRLILYMNNVEDSAYQRGELLQTINRLLNVFVAGQAFPKHRDAITHKVKTLSNFIDPHY